MVEPYALIASFYEAEYGRYEADVAFYARRAASGPLLVLGCGTGRVGRRLGTDRVVVGLDRSEPMLALARRLAPDARYVQGDMRDFDLGRFGEILIPNGGFNFLPTRADQQRCLAACRRALPEGGQLTIDMPMPAFHLWSSRHSPETTVWEGEVDGRHARRTRETTRSIAHQRLTLVDRYYVDDALVATSPLALRIVMPAEAEWMLEASGFYVDEILGDHGGGALDDDSPRILVRAIAT